MSDPKWLLEHKRRNQSTLDARELFAPHRHRVMQLIVQAASAPPGRLCVLGAGNCNDVDLNQLLTAFKEIVLVDVDAGAMESAVASVVPESLRERIRICDIDVSGIYGRLQDEDTKFVHSKSENYLLELLTSGVKIPYAPFDCVVSSCLLSQVIDSVFLTMGSNHPAIVPIILAIRKQHLRTITQSLVQGGRGLVVFDFLSSQTLPNLMQIDDAQLNQSLIGAINAKNFFTGLNPYAMLAELQTHSDFAGLLSQIRIHQPWRWDIGKRQFAVTAISFSRS